MMWSVICMDMAANKLVARFQIDARSIVDVLDSGAITLNTRGQRYDSVTIFRLPDTTNDNDDRTQ